MIIIRTFCTAGCRQNTQYRQIAVPSLYEPPKPTTVNSPVWYTSKMSLLSFSGGMFLDPRLGKSILNDILPRRSGNENRSGIVHGNDLPAERRLPGGCNERDRVAGFFGRHGI